MIKKSNFRKYAVIAARLADDKKAKDIKVVDLRGYSSLAEFVVIASIESAPQLEAISEEITKNLKEENVHSLYRDGVKSKTWRVYDFGGFFVHIITKEEREFYGLDKAYHMGKQVKWEKPKKAVLRKTVKVKKTALKKPKKTKK